MNRHVRVRVPASVANLGPGFDCLGLALALYLKLEVEEIPGSGPHRLDVTGEGADELPRNEENLLLRAILDACREHGVHPGRLHARVRNEIPLARGLGSSAAAFVAGRAAGHALSGVALDRAGLLAEGLGYEGHADNVAPSLMGGFTVVYRHGESIAWEQLRPPEEMRVVVAVPDFTLSTRTSRQALPRSVSREDAVHALSHTALAVAAVATGHLDLLGRAMEDRLHEPYRAPLVPGFAQVRRAALEAGALGAALSGAGPSIVALVLAPRADRIGAAMVTAWTRAGVESRALNVAIEGEGLQVETCSDGTVAGRKDSA